MFVMIVLFHCLFLRVRRPPSYRLFPYTTLFRSVAELLNEHFVMHGNWQGLSFGAVVVGWLRDRKSTRLNSSHLGSSYAVFCLTKKMMSLSRSCMTAT